MYCQKKFKSCEFVAKHIIMKHPENKDKVNYFFMQHIDLIMEEAYNADPNKITSYQVSREDRDTNRNRRPGGGYGYGYSRGRGR